MTKYSKDLASNKQLQSFIQAFYKQSDTKPPSQNDPYVNYFTPQATLIMGSKEVNGHDQVEQLRQNMWSGVSLRHHVVSNVAAVTETELLLNGYVEYTMADGANLSKSWGAHMMLDLSTEYKIKFYQVYIDSATPQN